MSYLKLYKTICVALFITLLLFGCSMSTGQPFPVAKVKDIQIDVTTQNDIRTFFGEPWRTGIEDGYKTWTYGQYTLKDSRDLVIRFDGNGLVKSYSFSSSFPEDRSL